MFFGETLADKPKRIVNTRKYKFKDPNVNKLIYCVYISHLVRDIKNISFKETLPAQGYT